MSRKMLKFLLRRRADSSDRVDGVRKQSSDSPFTILLTNFYWHYEWKSLGFKANWRPAVKVSKKGKKEKTLFLQLRGKFSFKSLGCERQAVYHSDHQHRQIWLPQRLGLQHLEPGYLRVSSATGQLPDPAPPSPVPPKKCPKKRQAGVKTPRV